MTVTNDTPATIDPTLALCRACSDSGWRPTFPGGDFVMCDCAAGVVEAELVAFATEVERQGAPDDPLGDGVFDPTDLTPPF
ncbi:MAG: hypothetical protein L0H93_21080 [Nocardioides sp.]|nr:hypothetical protein [Nocardioides sp.]